ncbi:MAG: single-stranded DNA-binding protein [Oscillospiraceae bacterium]|nr:single-stranded DNA-binding protein [Oscillospiraceae bacterium]
MLNNVSIMGRLTADPELRHTANNFAVTSFTVAVNRSFVRQGGERQTDFIDVVAWRNTAEFICRYFKKGQMIAVTGAIQTRNYTDKEGRNRKAVEIQANNVYFTESRAPGSVEVKAPENPDDGYDVSFAAGDADDFTLIADDDDLPF